MKFREARNVIRRWPPVWLALGRERKLLEGEDGVLADVYTKQQESAIYVVVRKCSEKFLGVILLKDCTVQARLLNLLRANVGRPIREIGDLEF